MMRKSHIFSSYFFPGLFLILCFRYLKVYLIHHYWKKPFNFYPFLIFGLTFSLFLCLSWPTRIYIHTAFHVFKCTILVFRVEILAGKYSKICRFTCWDELLSLQLKSLKKRKEWARVWLKDQECRIQYLILWKLYKIKLMPLLELWYAIVTRLLRLNTNCRPEFVT